MACEECDDADPGAFPGAPEVPDDGIDQDCDGLDAITCFVDADGDGEGGPATLVSADEDCDDAGESATDGDCDDADPATLLCPGSCAEVLAADPAALTDVYLLDPCADGSQIPYLCDMDTAPGGWTVGGRQDASAATTLGISEWGTPGDTWFSSDLNCVSFSEVLVFNETYADGFTQSYAQQTWSYSAINIAFGPVGDAFKHGTYGPSSSLIMMGCVGYSYSGGIYPQYACDTDSQGGARGHLADYAGEYCVGARLDYTWAWSDGSTCSYRGLPYTWGYAIR